MLLLPVRRRQAPSLQALLTKAQGTSSSVYGCTGFVLVQSLTLMVVKRNGDSHCPASLLHPTALLQTSPCGPRVCTSFLPSVLWSPFLNTGCYFLPSDNQSLQSSSYEVYPCICLWLPFRVKVSVESHKAFHVRTSEQFTN